MNTFMVYNDETVETLEMACDSVYKVEVNGEDYFACVECIHTEYNDVWTGYKFVTEMAPVIYIENVYHMIYDEDLDATIMSLIEDIDYNLLDAIVDEIKEEL